MNYGSAHHVQMLQMHVTNFYPGNMQMYPDFVIEKTGPL